MHETTDTDILGPETDHNPADWYYQTEEDKKDTVRVWETWND